jgi:hypothetical protein
VAVRVSRLNPPSVSVVQGSHPSQQYRQVARVSRRSQSLQLIVRVTGLSQPSESAVRVSSQGSSSEATNNHVCHPSQRSIPASGSHPARLMTSRHVRESISVDSVEQTPQPTHGTVPAMPVLSPAIRPVDPRRPKQRKRPQTVSASHTFDTNDPLQEPPLKRQQIPTARDNDLWTQWRNLAQDGRRST